MRQAKKILGLLLALVLVLAMAAPAFAATTPTGVITVKPVTGTSLAGKTFTAYKLLDAKKLADGTYVYTVPAGLEGFYAEQFGLNTFDSEFDVKVAQQISALKPNDSDALFAFAEAALTYCTTHGVSGTTGALEGANYKIPASTVATKLDSGYYLIADDGEKEPITALLLDTVTDANAEVTIKADIPTVDKKITSKNPSEDQKSNNTSIGDTVSYEITSKVPEMTGYHKYYFVLHDVLSKGLTFNEDNCNMVVKVDNQPLTKCTHAAGEKHVNCYDLEVIPETDATKINIIFKDFLQYADKEKKPVTVTYDVTLNDQAIINGANTNSVNLQYSNNPSDESDGDPDNPDKPGPNSPTGTTENSQTKTYTTKVQLVKENSDHAKLAGAQFHIEGTSMNIVKTKGWAFEEDAANGTYYKLSDGSFTETAPTTETASAYDPESTGKKYSRVSKDNTAVETKDVDLWVETDTDGIIKLEGLGAGDYTITEVKAPDGYNKLTEGISLKIEWVEPTKDKPDGGWKYIWKNDQENVDSFEYTVVNVAGSQMPTTGGIGTTIFYTAGSIMLIGAAVLLIAKRRMNAEK